MKYPLAVGRNDFLMKISARSAALLITTNIKAQISKSWQLLGLWHAGRKLSSSVAGTHLDRVHQTREH